MCTMSGSISLTLTLFSYTLAKKGPKNIWITWHISWVLLTSAIFHWKSLNFSPEISKYMCRLHFDTKFLITLAFVESLRIVLIKKVTSLMMSAKMVTPGLLKITVFWNKGYDVIIYCLWHHQQNVTRNSNYIVDVFMWQKFGNSKVSVTEVIIISIL